MTSISIKTPAPIKLLIIILFCITSLTATALTQARTSNQLKEITIQLPWKHQFEFAGLYAAIEQGYFSEKGLNVELIEYQNSGNITDVVLNKQADYGIASDNLLFARLQGKPVVVLANYFKKYPLVVLAQSGTNNLENLKGERLMISKKDQESMVIRTAFHQAGLVPDKNIELIPHTFNIESMIRGEVKAMTAFRTNETYFLEKNNFPYEIIELNNSISNMGGVNLFTSEEQARQQPDITRAVRDATNKGWKFALDHQSETVDLILRKYSTRKSRDALLFEAKKTREAMMPDEFPIGSISETHIQSALQILTAAGKLSDATNLKNLIFDNRNIECCDNSPLQINTITLTEEEKAWIKDHPVIRSHILDTPPFHYWKDGAKGISVDLLDLAVNNLGIKIEHTHGMSAAEAIKNIRNHKKTDLLHTFIRSPEREKFLVFTQDYMKQPRVLFTRQDENTIFSLDGLRNKTIAIEKSYLIQQQLTKEYPEIKQLLVNDASEALTAVSWNRADAYIGSQAAAQYHISKLGLSNLKVTALTDVDDHTAAFAIRNDWPLLAAIINKGLSTITQEERSAINRKYSNIEIIIQKGNFESLPWLLVAIAIILSFILLWNYMLRQRVAQSTIELQQHKNELESLLDANTIELRQLSRAVEQSHSTIVITDLNGHIEFVNPAFSRTTGYTKEEALGKNPKIMKSGNQDSDFYKTLWTTLISGDVWQGELLNKHKNGTLYWESATISPIKDNNGKTTHYVAIKEDITASKQADLTALEHRDQLVTFMETLPDAVILKDSEGHWLLTNEAGRKLFCLSNKDCIGKTDSELTNERPELAELHNAFTIGDDETWQHKEITVNYEEIKTTNGQKNILELRKMPIFGSNNEPKAIVIVSRDITEQRQNEAQLVEAQHRAIAANRAKSEFLSNMSHELRTPMNAILGFAQLMAFNDALDLEQRDNLNEISIAGNHLLELINEILDLAKIESGHIKLTFEQVNLTSLIEECFSLIKPVADKENINISYRDANGYFAYADKTRLKQVILNLLSNAIKYNRINGSVELTVQPANESNIRITISDTGKGIEKEKLKDLFQPFSRLDAEGSNIEGTGIGLTITQNLVNKMNGRINVDSMIGVGSQFWIELPQKPQVEQIEAETTSDNNTQKSLPVLTLKQQTILHIEDNPINIKLVDQILAEHEQYNLISSQEPKIALKLAAIHKPDLILTDIKMPQMDGFQLLSILKADNHLKDIPVIAITANAMPKDIKQGLEAGFVDYLTKPLDVRKFIEVLDQHLNA